MRAAILGSAAVLALGAQTGAPSYKTLRYPPLREVRIPEPVVHTLANGMKIYLLENHELPLINGVALVRTGNLFDPADKRGLAELTGMVMRTGGTKSRTGEQLDELLEGLAASVESSIGETSASVTFSALRESAGPVLEALRDLLAEPGFPADKFELARKQYRSGIARRNDEPEQITAREFPALVYGKDNPYGWPVEYEHIDRIRREDLVRFHERYFFPANVLLAVYGDFDTAALKARLEAVFGGWDAKQPPVPPFPAVTAKPAPGVFLAEKPDVTQTFFEIGHLGGMLKDRDYPALEVAANILGSGFTSRLFSRVRTKLGYAYAVSAAWGANYNHPGLFRISGSTKSQSTADTIEVIREEVGRMRDSAVTDQELATAKQTVLNSFVFFFDSPAKTLSRLLQYEYHGYPKDFLFAYQKAIAAVTKADVLRVARQYWKPENLTVLAVGNPKEFGRPLESLGKVQKLDLTIPEPKSAAAPVTAEAAARGKELLAKAQAALGGLEKLKAVADATRTLEMRVVSGPGSGMVFKQKTFYLGTHLRQEQELPFGRVTVFSDGASGWLATPQGVQPMPEVVIEQVKGESARLLPRLLAAAEAVASGPAVFAVSGVTVELDPESGLPKRIAYRSPGSPGEVEEIYSDWRESGGIRLPFAITMHQGGAKFAEIVVKEFTLNSGLKVEELAKKP
jgi:zinc protease